jgi:hypothetical protein
VNANQTRTVTGAPTGSWTLTEISTIDSSSDRSGNSITGIYTLIADSSTSTTIDQTSTSADGTTSFTVHSELDVTSDSTGDGNLITGETHLVDNRSRTETIEQNGHVGTKIIDYVSTTTDIGQFTTTGNMILGELSTTGSGTETYSFTQDMTFGSESYSLEGSGTKLYSRTETNNVITGEYSRATSGADTYELTQTGTDASGLYEVTLEGSDTFQIDETGNSDTGGFERTSSGDGSAERTETRGGVTTTENVTTDYVLEQEGNYLNGAVTHTVTGNHRYSELPAFVDASNGGTGTAGVLEFSVTGAPLMMGIGPAMPTGGGVGPVDPVAIESIYSHATQPFGSLAIASVPGLEAAGFLGLSTGNDLSYASAIGAFTDLGTGLLYEYCFAAGTRVLMADGSKKPIEDIEIGERVIAVPDKHPLATAEPREVVKVYHNAPQRLINLHFDDSIVRATFGHPFYVRDRGWVRAEQLQVGDNLRNQEGGWQTLTDIFDNGDVEPVYNLQVAGHHTYFVALDNGGSILVHNFSLEDLAEYLRALLQSITASLTSMVVNFAIDFAQFWNSLGSSVINVAANVWNYVSEHGDVIAAAFVSGALVGAGIGLLIVTGGAALPISMALIGAGIGSAYFGGLFEGKFNAQGYFLGMAGGAAVGAFAGFGIAAALTSVGTFGVIAGAGFGAANAALQTYASNPKATVGDYVFSMTLGAAFGAAMPLGAFLGFAGSVIGGQVAESMGFEWRHGVLVGGLLGDIAGSGVAAFTRGGSLRYALKAMAPELIGGGVGFAYGYYRTGTFEGGMQYASYGVMLGGITSAVFVKCFVAGTPVYVPVQSVPAATVSLAMAHYPDAVNVDESSILPDSPQILNASVALLVGLSGWCMGQMVLNHLRRREENEKKKYETAADAVFGSLAWN